MSMTHGQQGKENAPRRPPSAQSNHSSHSSSSSSKHVKCIGRYVLTSHTLGKGNFARVEAAVHTLTRAKVAVKIIETEKIKEEYVRKNLLREAQLMRRLRHPNVVRLYETMKTQQLYCLVMEMADGGELLSHVKNDFKERKLPEATTRPFIRQLVSALQYLHRNGIVHRDLKMENILLDKKKRNVKIVDFGLSNHKKPGALLQTHCGSPEYAAPELFIPGRQYGPEVDVWSLGVNMYAMLTGQLPFRSPRQGNKRRQKLLEQISSGITESQEKDMAHLSSGAKELIKRLLQPDASCRVTLEEVMLDPWITKEGTMPLAPYQNSPPDPATEQQVLEMMNLVLGEPIGQIKEAVKRDRCDWLASIYNLLLDQPEGRNILQRMMKEGPEEQLTSAAEFQGNTEHLSLSQSQQSQDVPDMMSDHTGLITLPTAPPPPHHNKHHYPYHHNHHQKQDRMEIDYESATLPLTKAEKRHHRAIDSWAIDQMKGHHSRPHHTLYSSGRRSSIEGQRHHIHQSHMDFSYNRPSLKLVEDPSYGYMHTEHTSRPHSRLSAPEPIPVPFQRSLLSKHHFYNGVQHTHSPVSGNSPPSRAKSPLNYSESSHHHRKTSSPHSAKGIARRKSGGNLRPVMKKSLSGSIDGQLDSTFTSIPLRGRAQVVPFQRRLSIDVPPIGWSGQAQFGSNNRLASVGKQVPADITSLMDNTVHASYRNELTLSHGELHHSTRVGGGESGREDGRVKSSDSIELKQEMFHNPKHSSHTIETATEGIEINMLPLQDDSSHRLHTHKKRSLSAKNMSFGLTGHRTEASSSAKYSGDRSLGYNEVGSFSAHKRELPSLDHHYSSLKGPGLEKTSPGGRRKSIGGLFGKAFKRGGGGGEDIRRERHMTPVMMNGLQN